jgi:hypothetical protein
MRTILIALTTLLAACDPCREPSGWTVTGECIPEGVALAVQTSWEASPCELAGWGGTIEYQLLPFPYGPDHALADGSADDVACNPRIKVASFMRPVEATALDHELGHVLWARCGLASYDFERGCHPRAYLEWVWRVDARVAEALGHAPPPAFEAPAWACPE